MDFRACSKWLVKWSKTLRETTKFKGKSCGKLSAFINAAEKPLNAVVLTAESTLIITALYEKLLSQSQLLHLIK